MSWSRAQFLRGSASLAAASLLPTAGAQEPVLDAVVVGGGLAGLNTARQLVARGRSVAVLEARQRVGGRTVNLSLEGDHVVEGGGEWIGPGQDRIAALAGELGVGTFPAFYDGSITYDLLGQVSRGLLPAASASDLANALLILRKLDLLAKAAPRGAAWQAPRAAEIDATSLDQWLRREQASPFTHAVFKLITRAVLAGYPQNISLLWVIHYVGAAGGVLPVILNDGGAQDLRFEGGSQLVSIRMHEALGERVRLGQPVRAILDRPGEPVRVRTPTAELRARRVVVAMMPADMLRIRCEPELPAPRSDLVRRWARLRRLPIIKASVIYDTPFWRAAGLSGAMQSDAAPLQLVFDNSPPDGSVGVLTAFLSVAEAPELADAARRPDRIAAELARYFGPRALQTRGYVEKDWAADPWSTGCLTPMPPGMLARVGPALRPPVGRIHWAGTETATRWCGYMDGAVRSGDRAAAEVDTALSADG